MHVPTGRLAPCRAIFEALELRVLFAAGSLDPSFGNGGVVTTSGQVLGLDVHDGKTVVASRLQNASSTDPSIKAGVVTCARYLSNGAKDGTFEATAAQRAGLSQFKYAAGLVMQTDGATIRCRRRSAFRRRRRR